MARQFELIINNFIEEQWKMNMRRCKCSEIVNYVKFYILFLLSKSDYHNNYLISKRFIMSNYVKHKIQGFKAAKV